MFKSSLETVCPWLQRVIAGVWESEVVPADWREAVLLPFFKKGTNGCAPTTAASVSSTSRPRSSSRFCYGGSKLPVIAAPAQLKAAFVQVGDVSITSSTCGALWRFATATNSSQLSALWTSRQPLTRWTDGRSGGSWKRTASHRNCCA